MSVFSFRFLFFLGGGGGGIVGGKNYLFNTVRLFIVLFFIVYLFFFPKPEDSFSPVYLFGQPLYWKQQGKPLAI